MNRREILAGLALAILPSGRAAALASDYLLDRERSTVGFSYVLNGQSLNGRMPVKSAQVRLDVDQPSQSTVEAVIDAAAADAGPFYATLAMKAPEVLDTAEFPEIRFRSGHIEGTAQGATVAGDLTVRGVTRQVLLDARLFRQRGTEAGDRRKLSILMTGTIDRRDFGASGFGQLVAPEIGLSILTRLELAGG